MGIACFSAARGIRGDLMDASITVDRTQPKKKESAYSNARYAIFYAPEKGSVLDNFGRHWLGRDATTTTPIKRIEIEGVFPEELARIVSSAAFYGFHGTLKPPFFLSPSASEKSLIQALKKFASKETPFYLPKLELSRMGRFLALTLEQPSKRANILAERCVRLFDPFRKPSTEVEINRRRTADLTPQQEQHLRQWGYPYVMDQFRFHLTLTGPIFNRSLADHLAQEISKKLTRLNLKDIKVNDICLFVQKAVEYPFILHSRYRFGDAIRRT